MDIIICGNLRFPRGSAGANYIQYFAMALAEVGNKVYIITDVNGSENEYLNNFLRKNKNIKVVDIGLSNNKIIHFLQYKYLLKKIIGKQLKKHIKNENTFVIGYSSNNNIHKAILNLKNKGVKCGACVVEWYPKEYFNGDKAKEKEYNKLFYSLFPKYDFLIPISSYIENHFKEIGSKTICVPILADPYEYNYSQKSLDTMDESINIIYPANGRIKDSVDEMLKAFGLLPDNEAKRINLHITGINKDKIVSCLGKDYQRIKEQIVLHSWMNYEELISLYSNMDYLLLARENNQLTRANFPSKVPEVMTYGVVPIVSEVGDYTKFYLTDKKNAIFLPGNDAFSIANTLKKVLKIDKKERLQMSIAARETVTEKFFYKNWGFQINDFLNCL